MTSKGGKTNETGNQAATVVFQMYLGTCARTIFFERAHYLFIYLIDVYI